MNQIRLEIYGLLLICMCLMTSCEQQDGCEILSFDRYEFEIGTDGGMIEARAKHKDDSWWLGKIKIEEILPDGNTQTKGEFQLQDGESPLQSTWTNFDHDYVTVKKEKTKLIVVMAPNNTGNVRVITILAGHFIGGRIVTIRQMAI